MGAQAILLVVLTPNEMGSLADLIAFPRLLTRQRFIVANDER